jgi:hypothetical protein
MTDMADTAPLPTPSAEENAEETAQLAEAWEALQPGQRAAKGSYSVYKTHEHNLLISFRTEDAAEGDPDQHLEIPGKLIGLAGQLQQGRLSPMQMVGALRAMSGFGG